MRTTHPDDCSKLQRDRIEKRKLKEKRDDAVRYIDELFNASPNGVINVSSFRCVKGISCIRIPKPEVSSSTASHSTNERRTQVLDTSMQFISSISGKSSEGGLDDWVEQLASHARRHRKTKLYTQVRSSVGIISSTKLDLNQLMALETAMSRSLTLKMKSFLKDQLNATSLGKAAPQGHYKKLEQPFRVGSVRNSAGVIGDYLVVDLLHDCIVNAATEFERKDQIRYPLKMRPDEFHYKIEFAKGGTEAKIILVIMPIENADSVNKVMLLGLFSGIKDKYEGFKLCFGTLFDEFNIL